VRGAEAGELTLLRYSWRGDERCQAHPLQPTSTRDSGAFEVLHGQLRAGTDPTEDARQRSSAYSTTSTTRANFDRGHHQTELVARKIVRLRLPRIWGCFLSSPTSRTSVATIHTPCVIVSSLRRITGLVMGGEVRVRPRRRAQTLARAYAVFSAGCAWRHSREYDKVMVRRFGSPSASNVLVSSLAPQGWSDFNIVGPTWPARTRLQVWQKTAEREHLRTTPYSSRRCTERSRSNRPSTTTRLDANPKSPRTPTSEGLQYSFIDQWAGHRHGRPHNVIASARDGGKRTVILGGHSLGGAKPLSTRPGISTAGRLQGHSGHHRNRCDAGGTAPTGVTAITTAAQATQALSILRQRTVA